MSSQIKIKKPSPITAIGVLQRELWAAIAKYDEVAADKELTRPTRRHFLKKLQQKKDELNSSIRFLGQKQIEKQN